MTTAAPDDRYEVLVEKTTELVSLLREFRADPWTDRVASGLQLIEAGDSQGLDRILALFGGMGSLNDLTIHPMNQHLIAEENVGEANDRLDSLRATVFSTARSLKREIDRLPRDR